MHKELPVVLLIIPNLGPGGAQRVFRQYYEYLGNYYKVHGCVFNWSGTSQSEWPNTIESLDVPGGSNSVQKILLFLQRISRLRKLKKRLRVNVSISHLEGADYINILSDVGEKKILWIHGTKKFDAAIRGWIGFVRKSFLMPLLYRRATGIVTVSRAITEEMTKSYPALQTKLHTVNNGVDWQRIQNLSRTSVHPKYEALCAKYFVIITHSRLALQKNLTGLLTIIQAMKYNPKIKWIIVGDGELRNVLVSDCETMAIDYYTEWDKREWDEKKQLFFLGHKENPFPYLKRASLYIMPSSWEGFPLALGEALACTLPVIATDCYTGPREIIAPGETVMPKTSRPEHAQFGLLMPLITKESLSVWTREIEELVNNKEKLTEYRGRATIRAKELSLDSALKQVHTTIDSVI